MLRMGAARATRSQPDLTKPISSAALAASRPELRLLLLLVVLVHQRMTGGSAACGGDGGRAQSQEFGLVWRGGGLAHRDADEELAVGVTFEDSP